VEVESTTRSRKERVAGFEDREGHRTPFASISHNTFELFSLIEKARGLRGRDRARALLESKMLSER